MVSGLINKSDADEISGGAKSMQVVGQFQRAALAISRMNGACRNLIFTAARGGSGTSTSALHIARHLRELGANPLLVELNRFNPSLTATLKLPEVSGVLAVAKGKPLDEAITTDSTGLAVLPLNGKWPVDLGVAPASEAILDRAKSYDYVLFDSPALHQSADVLAMGTVIPDVIMVIRAGRTGADSLSQARVQLEEAGMNIRGSILNMKQQIIPRWLDRWLEGS